MPYRTLSHKPRAGERAAVASAAIVAALLFSACASRNHRCPVLTDASQLDAHVGEIVILRGIVTNTKIPTITGVDVTSDDPDLRGRPAETTGLLWRWVVTEEDLREEQADPGPTSANRGPGVFYRLVDPHSNQTVQARPISANR